MNKNDQHQLKIKSQLSSEEEEVGRAVVHAAFYVHKTLGPGLLERVYEVCFCHVLSKNGYNVQRQIDIPVTFKIKHLMRG